MKNSCCKKHETMTQKCKSFGFYKTAVSFFPMLGIVLIPKCPFCLGAYMSLLGFLGLSTFAKGILIQILLSLFLFSGYGILVVSSWQSRRYLSLSLLLCSCLLILAGKFYWDNYWVVSSGIILMIVICFPQSWRLDFLKH